jgi:hypothetical protein
MSDPKRLLEDGEGDLGAVLLRAGRAVDAERARERRIALLGASGAAVSAAVAAASVSSGSKGIFVVGGWQQGWSAYLSGASVKWIAGGLLVAAVSIGAALWSTSGAGSKAGVERAVRSSAAEVVDAPNAAAASNEASAAAASNGASAAAASNAASMASTSSAASAANGKSTGGMPDTAAQNERRTPSAAKSAPGSTAPKAREGALEEALSDSSLADEVLALKTARSALAGGRPKRALVALNTYAQRFPAGRLSLEAEVLRIEALAQAGQAAEARARAGAFVAAHPSSPYAHRVRAAGGE